jgi:hypothetical protein
MGTVDSVRRRSTLHSNWIRSMQVAYVHLAPLPGSEHLKRKLLYLTARGQKRADMDV